MYHGIAEKSLSEFVSVELMAVGGDGVLASGSWDRGVYGPLN